MLFFIHEKSYPSQVNTAQRAAADVCIEQLPWLALNRVSVSRESDGNAGQGRLTVHPPLASSPLILATILTDIFSKMNQGDVFEV